MPFQPGIRIGLIMVLLGLPLWHPQIGLHMSPLYGNAVAANVPADKTAPAIRYVSTGGADSGDCLSVSSPCRTVQHAADMSQPNDTIHVAAGIYSEPDIETVGYVVVLTKTVSLQGGFPPLFDGPPNPGLHETVLDAEGKGRVLYVGGGAPIVEGFTITGGYGDYSGGGVRIENAAATLFGNLITGNHAEGDGGAIFANHSQVQIVDNTIISNTATWAGGMRIINNSEAVVVGNLVQENRAQIAGGGIDIACCGSTTVLVERNTIVNNQAGDRGGGIIVADTRAIVANNVVAGNSAQRGDAFFADGQPGYPVELDIIHNTIVGTGARAGEGLWASAHVTATLANNILAGFSVAITNSAPLDAAVIADHNLFFGNDTDAGSGVTNVAPFHGNPLFVAPGALDYHLQPGSPAIGKGLSGLTGVDIDEEPRHASPALGADEYWPPGSLQNIYLPAIRKP